MDKINFETLGPDPQMYFGENNFKIIGSQLLSNHFKIKKKLAN